MYEVVDLTHAALLDKNPEGVDAARIETPVGTACKIGNVEGDTIPGDGVSAKWNPGSLDRRRRRRLVGEVVWSQRHRSGGDTTLDPEKLTGLKSHH